MRYRCCNLIHNLITGFPPDIDPPQTELSIYFYNFGTFGIGDLDAGAFGVIPIGNGSGNIVSFLTGTAGYTQAGEIYYNAEFGQGPTVGWIECETGTAPTGWTWNPDGGGAVEIIWDVYAEPSVYACYRFDIDLGIDSVADYYLDPLNSTLGDAIVTGGGLTPLNDAGYPAEFDSYIKLAFGNTASSAVNILSGSTAEVFVYDCPIELTNITAIKISDPLTTIQFASNSIACP